MSLETTAWIVSLAGAAAFVIGGFVVGRAGRGRMLAMASVGELREGRAAAALAMEMTRGGSGGSGGAGSPGGPFPGNARDCPRKRRAIAFG